MNERLERAMRRTQYNEDQVRPSGGFTGKEFEQPVEPIPGQPPKLPFDPHAQPSHLRPGPERRVMRMNRPVRQTEPEDFTPTARPERIDWSQIPDDSPLQYLQGDPNAEFESGEDT